MEKICIKCNSKKDLSEFSKHKTNVDGFNNKCKKCVCEYGKEHRLKNVEKERERAKKYYENNKEKINQKNKNQNKKIYAKKYREDNKEKIKEKDKIRYQKNKEKHKDYRKKYFNKRIKNDFLFKLKKTIQRSILKSLKNNGFNKKSRTYEILGCSYEDFKLYLESKFQSWMNWDNHGLYNGELNYGWDIDHIVPLSSAKTEEEILKLNHYTNLQPLCSKVNRLIKKDLF